MDLEFLHKYTETLNSDKNLVLKGLHVGEIVSLLSECKRPIFFVAPNVEFAQNIYEQSLALNKKAVFLNNFDLPYMTSTFESQQNKISLLKSMYDLCTQNIDIVVTTPEALFVKVCSKSQFEKNILNIQVEQNYDLLSFVKRLAFLGYKRVESVQNCGDYAVRGDIIDIFAPNNANPIRINFFDDLIEKIYLFDEVNGTKISELKFINICPNKFVFLDNQQVDIIATGLQNIINKYNETNLQNVMSKLHMENDIDYEFLNLVENQGDYLYNLIDNADFCFVNTLQIENSFDSAKDNIFKRIDILFQNETLQNLQKKQYDLQFNDVVKINRFLMFDNTLNYENYNYDDLIEIKSIAFSDFLYKIELLLAETKKYLDKKIFLCLDNEDTLASIKNIFNKMQVNYSTIDNNEDINKYSKTGLILSSYHIPYNITFSESNVLYIGSVNFAHKKKVKTQKASYVKYLPKAGEYVVHDVHGIGVCEGVERITVMGVEKDYFKLRYRNNDILYVPIENTDCLSLYLSDSSSVHLNKLGGREFATIKKKAQEAIDDMAKELLLLYSARNNAKGFVYSKDDYLMTEFEQSFPYTETPDQSQAILDVKNDMTSSKIMDRLICGDVGYGKTEVALRAMFKAVLDGKQVAFMAPTTILSLQHYMSVIDRCKNFEIRVEMLNRFKSSKQQNQIIDDLKSGKINVVCGTHRLLSNDVGFKSLGLLILDEEQRFGVGAKEKIKQLKNNVDVLTMSATPIPRTLNMALLSLRDVSIINTPPQDRLPVKTYVLSYNPNIVVQAIKEEVARGGQILVVYNDIDKIYHLKNTLKTLVNDESVSFDVAHGQMNKIVLENAIKKLYDKETQVFVSTTLIENGVDLPKANTLIVLNSHRLGLAQMYQLRGRVGRSIEQAYAYFTYPKEDILTEDAVKRLEILAENTELGSGFKIAMRDLQMRGAGELLGRYQHGHMVKIGYDMYVKLLNDATSKLRGEKLEIQKDIKIDIALSANIPLNYIGDETERLKVYSKISNITDQESQKKVINFIKETYGEKIPQSVVQLCVVSLIKSLATKLNIKNISITPSNINIVFYSQNFNVNKLLKKISKYNKFSIKNAQMPTIYLKEKDFTVSNAQTYILNYLIDSQND